MKIDVKDIIRYELIGLNVKVVESKNKANIDIEGKIVDETKNTLIIEKKGKRKKLFKKNIILEIKVNKKPIQIKGDLLFGKSKERIKK